MPKVSTVEKPKWLSKHQQPVTEARQTVFLDNLRKFGIPILAARAASPHADARTGALSSFRDCASRDPVFSEAWREAQAQANAELERTAYQRAVEGVKEPIFQAGERMEDEDGNPAVITRYSDRLLERLLARRMPNEWSEKRQLEVSGGLSTDANRLYISAQDLIHLSDTDRADLGRILHRLAVARGEISEMQTVEGEGTPLIEHLPETGEALDSLALSPEDAADLAEILS
jgi:hypothetical protein